MSKLSETQIKQWRDYLPRMFVGDTSKELELLCDLALRARQSTERGKGKR